MESFWLRTPPDPVISRTVAPFFNTHKHLFWHMLWLESAEQGRVSTQISGIPLPELSCYVVQQQRHRLPTSPCQWPSRRLGHPTFLRVRSNSLSRRSVQKFISANTTNHVRPSRTIKAALRNVNCCPWGTGARGCLTHFV